MPFFASMDIANRCLQHCGATRIASPTEDSKNKSECAFAYDTVRRAELRRNVWRFAVRKAVLRPIDTTTMFLTAPVWSATTTYLSGAVVQDTNGLMWVSRTPDNINNPPGQLDVWDMYFGPLTVSLWDSTTAYQAGELVYLPTGIASGYAVFMSLISANSDTPNTATVYDPTVTYGSDSVVSYSGSQWRSLLPYNLAVTPADGPVKFDITATYSVSQQVTGSDNFIYTSIGSGNVGHDPTTDGGVHWTNTNTMNGWSRSPTLVVTSTNWRALSATIKSPQFLYPIGSGPSSESSSRNVFRLPAGYLREAPQDPKAGSYSTLGAPSGGLYDDWNFEGDFIVSQECDSIIFRFVADVTKVSAMDDMFCEGFAARLATEVCETITQSNAKLQTIASAYSKFMGEARTVNAIEEGPVEPPLDDYLACRA